MTAASASRPEALRTAYAVDPVGVGDRTPTLRWRASTDRRGERQGAFRVLVASSPERLAADEGDVWDTGKRVSGRPAVRYDGPPVESGTTYHWKVKVWDERGAESAWSEPASWETGLLDPEDWSASWIRRAPDAASGGEAENGDGGPGEGEGEGEDADLPGGGAVADETADHDAFDRGRFTYARRELALDGEVESARAYVTASHQYALSVNGETVDRGPAFSYPDFQYYRTVDVTDALGAGENAVGALYNWNGSGQGRPAAEPGFLLQLEVEFADGRERVVTTDGDWRVRAGEWLDEGLRNAEIAEPIEVIDGRGTPLGWDEPGFDDGDWEPAVVVGEHPTEPWERLLAQQRTVARHEVEPERIETVETDGEGDTYVVDFGKVYSGIPVVEFAGGEAGHRVDMLAGYLLNEDGTVDDTEGTQWTDTRYGYVQRDGEQAYRPFNYLGMRYFQVDDPGEDLDPGQIRLLATYNEVPDRHAATFECDDGTVEDVFALARHSALYGSQEQFIDTPTREKGQFLMDGFNISEVTTAAFGERRLTRGAIREFLRSHYRYWAPEGRFNAVYPNGDGKRDIPDFTVSFPEWLARYYRVSDDLRTVEEAYPVVRAVADYVVENADEETGLVTRLEGGEGGPYHEGIVDWPPEMRYGYDRDWPARTTVNVLSANALDRAAEFAALLDRPEAERAYFADNRDRIAAAVDEHLREGDRYVDGGDGTDASDQSSQHANALPVATGLAPDERVPALADRLAEDGMSMGPMMVRWLLDALDAADRPGAVVDLLTDDEADGWAKILAEDGTFTWETWHCRTLEPADERHNRSESHAMGATVLANIQRTLLGVRVEAPGAAELAVAPPDAGLGSASGTVPTERGPVHVDWHRAEDSFSLDVTVPWNASARVVLPASEWPERVTEGGDALVDDGTVVDDLPDGVEAVEGTADGVAVDVRAGTYEFDLAE